MANVIQKTKQRCYIMFLIALSFVLRDGLVDGRKIWTKKSVELVKHKGTVKTIKCEDGDIIDCVDIYQQPAFDHPALRNHSIQMEPNSIPGGLEVNSSLDDIFQDWRKYGECPEGAIPIRRPHKDEYRRVKFLSSHHTSKSIGSNHEYAIVVAKRGNYYGAKARLNVWNPAIYNGEASFSQIWITKGPFNDINTMEAGWMVDQPNNLTRFFIYWTSDGYKNTGCFNLHCPGFVQTNFQYVIGAAIKPLSSYNGQQRDINIAIYKHAQTGHWWLNLQGQQLGYWPDSIFNRLKDGADVINWGGEIVNLEQGGHHTSTQMGSGHFPREGFRRASYFSLLGILTTNSNTGNFKDPENVKRLVSKPSCYDLHIANYRSAGYGLHFYYGGPGYSINCQN